MAPPKKKKNPAGSVTIAGVTYSPALQALMKGAGEWPPGGGTAQASGTEIRLPNSGILEKEGVPPAIAKHYGLTKLDIPATGLDGSTETFSVGLKAALDKLPGDVRTIVENRLGFNDAKLGKTLDERIAAMLPVLQAANGHIGNVDLKLALANETAAASAASTKKVLGEYAAALSSSQQALSSGNEAALIGATASAKYTAEADADSDLTNWDIDTPEMDALVNRMVTHGVTNVNEILQNIRETSTYKSAFAGLAEYNAVPGHVHLTESEYRSYSQAVQGVAQQYGNVTMTQQMIGTLLKGNVTAPEFSQRAQDIAATINNLDPNAKALLQKEFDVNPEHLFAYWANPKEALPDMQRAVDTASIQDYASRVGLGGLTFGGAKQLADMAKASSTAGNQPLGYGVSNIEGSLLTASKDAPLLNSNPGAAKTGINTTALIGSQLAGFGGTNQPADQVAVQRAEEVKASPFEKGGGAEQTDRGVVGLGSART